MGRELVAKFPDSPPLVAERFNHRIRIVRNDIQQHQSWTLWYAVATFPMAQSRCRETEACRKLFLRHADFCSECFHIHRTGAVNARLWRTTVGVFNGLQQAALDAVECSAHVDFRFQI